MSKESQPVQLCDTVSDGLFNTISSRPIVPIVFVPGVMGSRLSMPQTGLSWDPDDIPSMASWIPLTNSMRASAIDTVLDGGLAEGALAAVAEAISPEAKKKRANRRALNPRLSSAQTMSALPISVVNEMLVHIDNAQHPDTPPAKPAEGLVGEGACLEFWERASPGCSLYEFWGRTRNWGSVCWSFYGPFLVYLENTLNSSQEHAEMHPVFAFGYDWRQSNKDSGVLLANFISSVLSQVHGATNVIVVTHSMGGLVLRGALSAAPSLESQIRGVVHGAQPTNGAVVCYRRFFTGCQPALDGAEAADAILGLIMGNDPQTYAFNLSGCPGPMELLPNHIYQQQYDQQGLAQASWVTDADWNVDLDDVYGMYRTYQWPGLLGSVDSAQSHLASRGDVASDAIKKEFLLNLASAKKFHAEIATKAHPVTFAAFSTTKTTDDSLAFGPYPDPTSAWTQPGWGAIGLGNDLTGMGKGVGDGTVPAISASCPALRLCEAPRFVRGVEHSQVYNDVHFRRQVTIYINKLLVPDDALESMGQKAKTWLLSEALPVEVRA